MNYYTLPLKMIRPAYRLKTSDIGARSVSVMGKIIQFGPTAFFLFMKMKKIR